jgi:ADP-ribose pyrophosphatase YjhB (NUDIX family)
MVRRVDTGEWAWPGGHLKEGETAEKAAMREFFEECSHRLGSVGAQLMRRIRDGADFTTFITDVDDEFAPKLNHEHSAWAWVDPHEVLEEASEES